MRGGERYAMLFCSARMRYTDEFICHTGGLCGSIFIDDEFERFMSLRIPWSRLEEWKRKEVMKQWETGIKRNYLPSRNRNYQIIVPDLPGRLLFNRYEGCPALESR
jgi:hypothetical protein